MERIALRISQIDTLFFRDARPFGPASHAQSGLPMPQTLTGAIRTLLLDYHGIDWQDFRSRVREHDSFRQCLASLGTEFEKVADVRVRGPWLFHNNEVLVPAPLSLRKTKAGDPQQLLRLDPLIAPPPGWRPPYPGIHPLWRRKRGALEATPAYIRPQGLKVFLQGRTPCAADFRKGEELFSYDRRTGIGRNRASGTAGDGMIYTVNLLALKQGVSFYSEITGPKNILSVFTDRQRVMRLGGEGRHVTIDTLQRPFEWPSADLADANGRVLLLTTPAYLNDDFCQDMGILAAAIGEPVAISGWDMARGGPKPNRFMMPAGSVLFLSPGVQSPMHLGLPFRHK